MEPFPFQRWEKSLTARMSVASGTPSVNFGMRFLTICFAPAYLVISLAIFARRWFGQRRSEEMHTGEAGYSWLVWKTSLPVPLCEQVLVPLGAAGSRATQQRRQSPHCWFKKYALRARSTGWLWQKTLLSTPISKFHFASS
jgi:hypothetical protein